MPRKRGDEGRAGALDGGFNEAEAEMPRKPTSTIERTVKAALASMRPRQKCPGNALSEAVAGRPGWIASMRPRQKCPGNVLIDARSYRKSLALQ